MPDTRVSCPTRRRAFAQGDIKLAFDRRRGCRREGPLELVPIEFWPGQCRAYVGSGGQPLRVCLRSGPGDSGHTRLSV